jgi:hypothetical protein
LFGKALATRSRLLFAKEAASLSDMVWLLVSCQPLEM